MPKTLLFPLSLLLALFLSACAESQQTASETPFFQNPAEQGQSCRPSVDEELARLGVDQADIESVTFRRRETNFLVAGSRQRRLQGFDAWVRPKDTAGYLVVQMFVNCSVDRVYTRGNYVLTDVKHY